MADWLTPEQACALVGRESASASADAYVASVAAARAHVEVKRPDLYDSEAQEFAPGADVLLGTAMLAERWYARRGSPLGVAEFSEFAGGILRHDPDIAKLLGIGSEGAFIFGAGPTRAY